MPTHFDQFARTRRWYRRFASISAGVSFPADGASSSEDLHDEVYAFFQSCYHLKDWLKNDPASAAQGSGIEAFINANTDLCICADLCNGTKHLLLTTLRGGGAHFGVKSVLLELHDSLSPSGSGDDPPRLSIRYEVITPTGALDAFALATRCLSAWEDLYLREFGVPKTLP